MKTGKNNEKIKIFIINNLNEKKIDFNIEEFIENPFQIFRNFRENEKLDLIKNDVS